ncbi:MAG: PatA/PatG family cyanobactin maturation protease [Candidatus Competibacteraceae bacterium]
MPPSDNPTQAISSIDIAEIPGLKALWAETLGDPRICIAVLDGSVDQSHPSLAGANLTRIETLVSHVSPRGPALQHGTHVASIIFGQHDGPIKGIAPRCRGLILPVFSNRQDDDSLIPGSQLDLARALHQAVQEGAQIINISGGEFAPSGRAHPFLANAVQYCIGRGVLIVAAAGNEGCDCLHIPGALPGVLAVGAMNSQGLPLGFSNWGEKYQTQGILAPGENIPGASPGGSITASSGTSYATPIVSGIVALLSSLQLKNGQKPDPDAVHKAILDSALGCEDRSASDCRRLLAGRLNISGAMSRLTHREDHNMSNSIETQPISSTMVQSHMPGNLNHKPSFAQTPASPGQVAPPSSGDSGMCRSVLQATPKVTPKVRASEGPECQCRGEYNGVETPSSEGPYDNNATAQLVFALGKLWYDFGTEARRDSIQQYMKPPSNNPYDPEHLLGYLEDNPWDAAAIYWTLNLDATSIYALQPQGPFASDIYKLLRNFLEAQIKAEGTGDTIERVSIPGYIVGNVMLFNGQVVPVIQPSQRGMAAWNTQELIAALIAEVFRNQPPSDTTKEGFSKIFKVFLNRIYEELRNLGITPQERAVNYAATNALKAAEIFKDVYELQLELDTIEVERSPICRPESDCWDIRLIFYNPEKVFQQARRVYLFTIDVSDVAPVVIRKVRSWSIR